MPRFEDETRVIKKTLVSSGNARRYPENVRVTRETIDIVRFHVNNRHARAGLLNAFLWSVAVSPIEAAVFLFVLAPTIGFVASVVVLYLYAPGFYLMKPLIDAIPYKGWLISLIHVTLAMTVQNFFIWAAILWWQTRRVVAREI